MTRNAALAYVAICPKTGRHMRRATQDEIAAYLSQPARPAFRRPVTVGSVTIDTYAGGGIWFGGAGF